MLMTNLSSHDARFFGGSALMFPPTQFDKDPQPFGLQFQEAFYMNENNSPEQGITMGQSPTNTPSGSDSCLDMDYEF